MLRALWLVAALACSRPPAAPQPPAPPLDAAVPDAPLTLDQDLPELAARSLAMYEELAVALIDTTEDCASVAARLTQLGARYRDVVTANAKVVREGRSDRLRTALAPHDDAFDRAARAIMQSPTMSRCARDPVFSEAFDKLLEPTP